MTVVVVATYEHPQGKRAQILSNDALIVTKAGKPAKTGATAQDLRNGRGGWTLVPDGSTPAETAAAIALPAAKAAPALILLPMKFKETPCSTAGDFITDDNWTFQQKVDGIRAQLVVAPGEKPWFRNGSGVVLASAVAAPTTNAILAAMSPLAAHETGYTVDGEVLNGVFYIFDLISDGGERTPLADRLDDLAAWWDIIVATDLGDRIELLPTARTDAEKRTLWTAIKDQGAEGVIAKRLDGTYDYGQRVTHSLKLKLTHTADVVVMERNRKVENNAVLGMYDETGTLVEVGTVSTIGKGEIKVGQVIEIKTLYAGANHKMVQPSILRVRPDRTPESCETSQMKFAGKGVVSLAAASV